MKKKKKFAFIGVLIILGAVLYLIYINRNNEEKNNEIKSFHYSYGSFLNGYLDYDIREENGTIFLSASGKNGIDLEIDKEVDEKILEDIEKLIEDNHIENWNGFSEVDHDILDGYSYNLIIKYKNGKKLLATGYMKFPANYEQGHKALTEYLEELE